MQSRLGKFKKKLLGYTPRKTFIYSNKISLNQRNLCIAVRAKKDFFNSQKCFFFRFNQILLVDGIFTNLMYIQESVYDSFLLLSKNLNSFIYLAKN